jgi:hypothetical protein
VPFVPDVEHSMSISAVTHATAGKFRAVYDGKVVCDLTGIPLGRTGDSIDPKFGAYRANSSDIFEIEYSDVVLA